MRSISIHHALFVVAMAIGALPSDADAKPRRVVVLDFDGPRQLADTGRSAVMGVLGEQYNIVATRNWDAARARATGRGPQQWRQASKQAGVDAVIEGWVQAEGRHHVLTIAVKDAATGQEIDTLSVRLKERGVTSEATHKLAAELDDLLSWIDTDVTAEPSTRLPDVRTQRPALGSREDERERGRERNLVADDGDETERRGARGRRRAARDDRDDRDDRDEREDRDEGRRARDDRDHDRDERDGDRRHRDPQDREDREDRDGDRRDREGDRRDREGDRRDRDERRATRSIARLDVEARDTNDLVTLLGDESKEADIATDGKLSHVPRPTPRFFIGVGPYLAARGMKFGYDVPDTSSPRPPSYPASFVKGLAAHAEVFPMPSKKMDGKLHGLGFSLDVAKSVASTLTIENRDAMSFVECEVDQTSWQLATHYRWPIDFVTVGVQASYGASGHTIVDAPEDLGFADTAYKYFGAGANVELAVTERATVGFHGRYQYLFAAGNVTDEQAYGSGRAYGLGVGADFVIPLPSSLYVRGAFDYQRFKVALEGSGELAKEMGVYEVVDGAITGSANLGVTF